MIKVKPASNLQPVKFEWDSQFKVLVRDVPPDRRRELIKEAGEVTWNAKHQKVNDTNWHKYGMAYMREAIAGWEGLTYRTLLDICRPFDLEPGIKLDDTIEFSQENLEYVIQNHRPEFNLFISHAIEQLDGIYTEQKRKELENL